MQQLKFEEEVMKSLPCTQAEFYRTCKEAFRDVGKQTNYAQSILQSEAKMATQKVNRAAQKTKKEQKGELQEPAIQNNQAGPSTSIDQQDQQTAASGTGPGTRNRKPAAKKPAAAKPKGKKKANDAEKINMPEIRPSRGTAEKRKSPAPHDTINNPRLGLRARTRQGGGIAATSMPQDAVSVNKLNPKIHRPVVPNGQGSQLQQARHFTQQSGVNAPMYLPQTQDQSHQYPHDPRNPQHRHGPHVQNSNPFSNFNQPIPNPGQWNYQTQNHPGLYTPSGTRASMDPRNIHDQFPPHGYNG
ncbi:hypothetical protein DFH27DRAFT_566923 [Peziza echinospora]|nr:hypothetical protein DFH27DRAFT_566923 [Peziza echinospora]